ncbi:MAG: hypothetical protein ACRER2_10735 [Methylococcales bacterium]
METVAWRMGRLRDFPVYQRPISIAAARLDKKAGLLFNSIQSAGSQYCGAIWSDLGQVGAIVSLPSGCGFLFFQLFQRLQLKSMPNASDRSRSPAVVEDKLLFAGKQPAAPSDEKRNVCPALTRAEKMSITSKT